MKAELKSHVLKFRQWTKGAKRSMFL